MSTIIESLERRQLRDVPAFKAGDTVRVHFKVIEGNRQRVQVFEGICIKRQGSGVRETEPELLGRAKPRKPRARAPRPQPAPALRKAAAKKPAVRRATRVRKTAASKANDGTDS